MSDVSLRHGGVQSPTSKAALRLLRSVGFDSVGIIACLIAALLIGSLTSHLEAQAPVRWQALGWSYFDDVTGRPDSTAKFAREIGPNMFVFRTDYRSDRTTSTGARWRSSYLTARIDCGQRTMEFIRRDYFANDSTLVRTLPGGLTLSGAMIQSSEGFTLYYNFACTIRKPM